MSGEPAEDGRDEGEIEESPATDFGIKLGVPLVLVALAWAFIGPAHLLEVGRYELPIVASFVEPLPYLFFGYVGAVTFAFALVGAVVFPSRAEEANDEYAVDLAIGLILPAVGVVVLMAVLGFVFPALFYLVAGEIGRAGLILAGVAVILVAAFLLRTIAILVIALWSAPLWVPAIAGAYVGAFVQGVGA